MKLYSGFDLGNKYLQDTMQNVLFEAWKKDHLETIYWTILHFQQETLQTSVTDMPYFRKCVRDIAFLLIKSHLKCPKDAFLQKAGPGHFPITDPKFLHCSCRGRSHVRYQMLLCLGKAQRNQPDLN